MIGVESDLGLRIFLTDLNRRVSRSQRSQHVFCCYAHVRLMTEKTSVRL